MFRKNIARRFARVKAVAFMMALAALTFFCSVPHAHAQTSSPTPDPDAFIDFASVATAAKGQVSSANAAYVPVVIGIMVGLACIGGLIGWLRRAPKAK